MTNDWELEAKCRKMDPELFFPDDPATNDAVIKNARSICAECPVQEPCLEKALAGRHRGVWAGTTEADRRRILRQRRLAG